MGFSPFLSSFCLFSFPFFLLFILLSFFFLQRVLEDRSNEAAAAKSLQVFLSSYIFLFSLFFSLSLFYIDEQVVIELYRREVWRDAKTVNVISTGFISINFNFDDPCSLLVSSPPIFSVSSFLSFSDQKIFLSFYN